MQKYCTPPSLCLPCTLSLPLSPTRSLYSATCATLNSRCRSVVNLTILMSKIRHSAIWWRSFGFSLPLNTKHVHFVLYFFFFVSSLFTSVLFKKKKNRTRLLFFLWSAWCARAVSQQSTIAQCTRVRKETERERTTRKKKRTYIS